MQTEHGASISLDDLHSVEGLASQFPGILSADTLRWQLRDRARNGLASATVKVGKRLMISRTRYEHWLASRVGA